MWVALVDPPERLSVLPSPQSILIVLMLPPGKLVDEARESVTICDVRAVLGPVTVRAGCASTMISLVILFACPRLSVTVRLAVKVPRLL